MVDNRGVTPVTSGFNFKSGDISGTAAKTSEEKMGQGGEYFAQEVEEQEEKTPTFQDRSAQLRASLDSLALANAGALRLKKMLEEKDKKDRTIQKEKEEKEENKKRPHEYLYDE